MLTTLVPPTACSADRQYSCWRLEPSLGSLPSSLICSLVDSLDLDSPLGSTGRICPEVNVHLRFHDISFLQHEIPVRVVSLAVVDTPANDETVVTSDRHALLLLLKQLMARVPFA